MYFIEIIASYLFYYMSVWDETGFVQQDNASTQKNIGGKIQQKCASLKFAGEIFFQQAQLPVLNVCDLSLSIHDIIVLQNGWSQECGINNLFGL
jgi:hypothetical protein